MSLPSGRSKTIFFSTGDQEKPPAFAASRRRPLPSGSPDGRRIVVLRRHPNARDAPHAGDELYVVRADGSHIVRLTRNWMPDDSPTWSPNGREIAFVGRLA